MYDTVKKKERYYTMAEARPTEERIAELDKKIEQIKAQKKAILQREKQAISIHAPTRGATSSARSSP